MPIEKGGVTDRNNRERVKNITPVLDEETRGGKGGVNEWTEKEFGFGKGRGASRVIRGILRHVVGWVSFPGRT